MPTSEQLQNTASLEEIKAYNQYIEEPPAEEGDDKKKEEEKKKEEKEEEVLFNDMIS